MSKITETYNCPPNVDCPCYTKMWDEIDRLRAEVERLRAGGCARDQNTTQYCAEAARMTAENERLRAEVARLQKTLEFVERWAVYKRFKADAAKRVSDEDAANTIASHPTIREITARMEELSRAALEDKSDE